MISDQLFLGTYAALWLIVVAEAVGLFLIFRQFGVMYMNSREGVEKDGLEVGSKAPNFVLPAAGGGTLALSDALSTKSGALVLFGAPHCRPCHQLLPELHQFAQAYAEDFATLFVSRGTDEENRYFAATFGVPALLLFDELEGKTADRYRSHVTPFAFMVDGEGTIRAKGIVNGFHQLVHMADSVPVERAESVGADAGTPARVNTMLKEA